MTKEELEKENAELKESGSVICDRLSERIDETVELKNENIGLKNQLTKAKELIRELSKSLFLAKGIIRDLIDDTVDFKESKERATYCYEQEYFDTYHKAEQFLNSEVEK